MVLFGLAAIEIAHCAQYLGPQIMIVRQSAQPRRFPVIFFSRLVVILKLSQTAQHIITLDNKSGISGLHAHFQRFVRIIQADFEWKLLDNTKVEFEYGGSVACAFNPF